MPPSTPQSEDACEELCETDGCKQRKAVLTRDVRKRSSSPQGTSVPSFDPSRLASMQRLTRSQRSRRSQRACPSCSSAPVWIFPSHVVEAACQSRSESNHVARLRDHV